MGLIKLNEYLEKEKELHSGIAVSSSIINTGALIFSSKIK